MKPDVSGTPIPRCKACGMGAGERCEDHDVEAPCGAHGIVSASDESRNPMWAVGDRVVFLTGDHELTRLSEQDGSVGTVDEIQNAREVWVLPDGGGWDQILCDNYDIEALAEIAKRVRSYRRHLA